MNANVFEFVVRFVTFFCQSVGSRLLAEMSWNENFNQHAVSLVSCVCLFVDYRIVALLVRSSLLTIQKQSSPNFIHR